MPQDHYVPRLYLRNFQMPSKRGWVISYQRGHKAKPKAIRSVASIANFEKLSREAEGLEHDTISKRLKQIEYNAVPVLARLSVSEALTLTAHEWKDVCHFVSYLIARGPTGRQGSINLFQAMSITSAKVMAENKDLFHKTMRDGDTPYTDDEIEEIRLKTLDFENHYTLTAEDDFFKDFSLVTSLLAGEVGIQVLVQKYPVLIKHLSSQREFITSDNPVVYLVDDERYVGGTGLGLENSLTYMSISPNRALLLVNKRPKKNVVTVQREQIVEFNSQVMVYARDSLFSQTLNQKIEEQFSKVPERRAETVVVQNNRKISEFSGNELADQKNRP